MQRIRSHIPRPISEARGRIGVPVIFQRPQMAGLGLTTGTGTTNQATKSISMVSEGASIGATAGSIVPGIGTAIGAAVGAVVGAVGSLFGPAKEGLSEQTWDDMVQHGYLAAQRGINFDEKYIGEAYKGAMDKGTNDWPACGSSGHTNPDCFYGPLAQTIVKGYLNKVVPLTATTAQVFNSVVIPWLQNGANGLFNWPSFVAEEGVQTAHGIPNYQRLLIQAATDRYINGLPITRANMPAYSSEGNVYNQWSQPSIAVALASLIPKPAPAPVAKTLPTAPPPVAQSNSATHLVAPVSTPPKAAITPAPLPQAAVTPVPMSAPAPVVSSYDPTSLPAPIVDSSVPDATAPVAVQAAPDNTLLYLLGGGVLIYFLTKGKQKK